MILTKKVSSGKGYAVVAIAVVLFFVVVSIYQSRADQAYDDLMSALSAPITGISK